MPMIFFFLHATSATCFLFLVFSRYKKKQKQSSKASKASWQVFGYDRVPLSCFSMCMRVSVCVSVLCGAHGLVLCFETNKNIIFFKIFISPSFLFLYWSQHMAPSGFCVCMHACASVTKSTSLKKKKKRSMSDSPRSLYFMCAPGQLTILINSWIPHGFDPFSAKFVQRKTHTHTKTHRVAKIEILLTKTVWCKLAIITTIIMIGRN